MTEMPDSNLLPPSPIKIAHLLGLRFNLDYS